MTAQQDTKQDFEALLMAANKGDASAQNNLGVHYASMENPDAKSALVFFLKAAAQSDKQAQKNLQILCIKHNISSDSVEQMAQALNVPTGAPRFSDAVTTPKRYGEEPLPRVSTPSYALSSGASAAFIPA